MRAIGFILKLLLKIVVAPVILVLTLFVWICVGIVYISGLVLGLISMVIALLGVAVLLTLSLIHIFPSTVQNTKNSLNSCFGQTAAMLTIPSFFPLTLSLIHI